VPTFNVSEDDEPLLDEPHAAVKLSAPTVANAARTMLNRAIDMDPLRVTRTLMYLGNVRESSTRSNKFHIARKRLTKT
jgi:hypothetical protein